MCLGSSVTVTSRHACIYRVRVDGERKENENYRPFLESETASSSGLSSS
jgi:hypothetical protein